MSLFCCRLYALKEVPLDERSKHRTKESVVSEAKYADPLVTNVANYAVYTFAEKQFSSCFNSMYPPLS